MLAYGVDKPLAFRDNRPPEELPNEADSNLDDDFARWLAKWLYRPGGQNGKRGTINFNNGQNG